MRKLGRLLVSLAFLALPLGLPGQAAAKTISGLTVSPALQSITISQTQAAKSFDFYVTNNDPVEQEFHLATIDFGSLDDSGGILFLGPEKALSYKYGLARWITLEKDAVALMPHETQKVIVTIHNKDSLAPGGHYGAVLVTPQLARGTPTPQTQINQVASSLLFLTKEGGAHYSLKLANYSLAAAAVRLPGTLDLRFRNAGNIHVVPRGLVTVTDPFGRTVQKGIINSDSGLALPESFREIAAPLARTATSWAPGVYHAHISYYYEGQAGDRSTLEVSFLYLNGWYVVGLAALGAAGAYLKMRPRRWEQLRGPLVWRHLRRLLVKLRF